VEVGDGFKEAMAAGRPGGRRERQGRRWVPRADGHSFTSASLAPPLLLVCLDSLSQTRDAVAGRGEFSLSVLERSQEFLAERFAGRAPLVDPTWAEVPHTVGGHGLPVLLGSVAWFECRLLDLHPGRRP